MRNSGESGVGGIGHISGGLISNGGSAEQMQLLNRLSDDPRLSKDIRLSAELYQNS